MQKKRFQVSLDIVHCDGFVSMPATAQALYLQILSVCDDEGFTSQLTVCKVLAHATDEDVDELVSKEFIFLVGERKVAVVKHWKMNTYMHDGKYDPSDFSERSLVFIKPNGNYTLNPEEGTPLDKSIPESKRNQNGMKTESVQSIPPSCDPSARGAPTRCPSAVPERGSQSNPIQSNTLQSNPIHTNTLHNNPSNAVSTTPTPDCGKPAINDADEFDI